MSLRVGEFKSLMIGILFLMFVFSHIAYGGIRYNEKCTVKNGDISECWAVYDSGVVMKLKDDSIINQQILLNGIYNFTSVSFATSSIGWIVGYKKDVMRSAIERSKDDSDKWKGVILKTIDSGKTWINLFPYIPSFPKPTPFLKVRSFNKYNVLVICGNSYNLITMDGGISWFLSSKPINNVIINYK